MRVKKLNWIILGWSKVSMAPSSAPLEAPLSWKSSGEDSSVSEEKEEKVGLEGHELSTEEAKGFGGRKNNCISNTFDLLR